MLTHKHSLAAMPGSQVEQEEAAKATAAKIQEAVDAVQFGIVISPGDDIAAAIDSLSDEGGKIFLKRGVHELSTPLVVTKAITFVGEGSATVLKRRINDDDTDKGPILQIAGSAADSPLLHVTVRSLQIECNGDKATAGVVLENVQSSFVEHVQFRSCIKDVVLSATSTKNWIQDNQM